VKSEKLKGRSSEEIKDKSEERSRNLEIKFS